MPIPMTDANGVRTLLLDDGSQVVTPETTGTEAQQIAFQRSIRNLGRGFQAFFGGDREPLREEALAEREQFEGVTAERPFNSLFGDILPVALGTGPIGAQRKIMAALATSGVIGAAEGTFDFDPEATGQGLRAIEGAESAIAGDMAFRVLGRMGNAARGLFGKLFADEIPEAKRLRDVGGRPTAGQAIGSRQVRGIEESLSSDFLTSGAFDEIAEVNQKASRDALSRAVGIPEETLPPRLTEGIFDQVATRLERNFDGVGESVGRLDVGEDFAERVLTLEQFRKLRGVGGLPNLDQGLVDGDDFSTVRAALSEEMGQAFDKGQGQLGIRIRRMIDELDNKAAESISQVHGPEEATEILEGFARDREQWRVLKVAEMPNVVTGGQVNAATLNSRLRSNFGTTATRGRADQATNQATVDLIETAGALADPAVRPIVGSSGTAERQATREAVSNPVGAAVRGAASIPIRRFEASPAGAQGVAGALSPSPLIFPQAGRTLGIGLADEEPSPADIVNMLLLQQLQR